MTTKTGLSREYATIAAPAYGPLRLTIPAREALDRNGNHVERVAGEFVGPMYRVTLAGDIPAGVVLCLIGYGSDQHRGLRLDDEPEYPGEWRDGGLSWAERGSWVPCPQCGAALVSHEAGYVPGYRVCARAPHHHAQLDDGGRAATSVAQ